MPPTRLVPPSQEGARTVRLRRTASGSWTGRRPRKGRSAWHQPLVVSGRRQDGGGARSSPWPGRGSDIAIAAISGQTVISGSSLTTATLDPVANAAVMARSAQRRTSRRRVDASKSPASLALASASGLTGIPMSGTAAG